MEQLKAIIKDIEEKQSIQIYETYVIPTYGSSDAEEKELHFNYISAENAYDSLKSFVGDNPKDSYTRNLDKIIYTLKEKAIIDEFEASYFDEDEVYKRLEK